MTINEFQNDSKTHSKKPTGYSREQNDKYDYEFRVGVNTTSENNNPSISIKGISRCYNQECNSNNLKYFNKRDEVVCLSCGSVLRQNFDDYKELYSPSESKKDNIYYKDEESFLNEKNE